MLTLSEAITNGRLDEFIEQEEKRLAPHTIEQTEFDEALSIIIRPRQSVDQTSHSAFDDDLNEK